MALLTPLRRHTLPIPNRPKPMNGAVPVACPLAANLVGAYFLDGTLLVLNGAGARTGRASLVGGATPAAGRLGASTRFDGSTGGYTVPAVQQLSLSGALTCVAWINLESVAVQGRDVCSDAGVSQQFACLVNGANIRMTWGGTIVVTGAATMRRAQWYQLAWVRYGITGAWVAEVYVNGELDGMATTATNPAVQSGIGIGKRGTTSTNFFPGSIESVLLFNRRLEGGEIHQLYTDPYPMFATSRRRLPLSGVTGITFDAASNSAYQTLGTSYSWDHTCTGSNRFLSVDVGLLGLAGTTVTSITYNSVALSLIGAQSSGAGAVRTESWGLVAPATGTNSIVVTFSGSIGAGASAGTAASYAGAHQTSPTEAFNGATATNVGAADATVTITTVAANDWVHAAVATDDATITAGQTSRNNVTGVLGSGANEDTGPNATPGTQAMTYTNVAGLATWAIAGYAIRPVAAAALAQTLTVSASLLAWLAATSRLTRVLPVTPSMMAWQPPMPLGRRTLLAAPGLEAWQMTTPALLSRLLTTPAQESWQANMSLGHRRLQVAPSLEAWQASTPSTRYVLTPAAAQEAWLVQAALGSRQLQVTPSLEAWRVVAAVVTASLRASPAVMAWLTASPLHTRSLLVSPGLEAWQVPASLLHRRLLVSPSLEAWQASALLLRSVLTPPAVAEAWQAATALSSVRLSVRAALLAWFAPSAIVGGMRLVTVTPAQMLWHPETAALARALRTTPAQMAWLAQTGRMAQSLISQPSQMAWQAQAPLGSRRLQASPSRMVWQPGTPRLLNAVLVLPSRMAWLAGAPTIPASQQLIVVLPSRMAWQAQAGIDNIPRTVLVTPAQMAWLAQQAILAQTAGPFARRAIPVILSINERNEAVILGFV